MKKYCLLSILLIAINSRGSFCPWGNYPVCGVDYQTYANQCDLGAKYVELLHTGPCRKLMIEGVFYQNCPQVYKPVCGRDGVTYLNKCSLEVNDTVIAFNGPCNNINYIQHEPAIECNCANTPFRPVCSLGGENYENECILNCTQQIAQSTDSPCSSACECPKKYQPVCGVDGLTYDNDCTLKCVKVLKQGEGECPALLKGCEYCSDVFMPVCGTNGKTFRNLCELKCNGSRFQNFGKCDPILIKKTTCDMCSTVVMPICGTDGINYQNECLCTCKDNCKKYAEGRCPESDYNDSVPSNCNLCKGTAQLVCGINGVTYDNRCFAGCAGMRIKHNGACDNQTMFY
jgi:hypothetical protein